MQQKKKDGIPLGLYAGLVVSVILLMIITGGSAWVLLAPGPGEIAISGDDAEAAGREADVTRGVVELSAADAASSAETSGLPAGESGQKAAAAGASGQEAGGNVAEAAGGTLNQDAGANAAEAAAGTPGQDAGVSAAAAGDASKRDAGGNAAAAGEAPGQDAGADAAEAAAQGMPAQATSGAADGTPAAEVLTSNNGQPVIGSTTGYLEDGTPVDLTEVNLNSPTIRSMTDASFWNGCPERDVVLLTPNEFSRCRDRLVEVHDIVIHYVGNPGTSAMDNRDYFEDLKFGQGTSASSHFVVGLEGEILQCVPVSEIAYATKERNVDTISIEVCHPDETGQFSDVTYQSTVRLTAWLCHAFGIGPEHVIRHYDVTGKLCPLYYVEHQDAWDQLLADVKAEYENMAAS